MTRDTAEPDIKHEAVGRRVKPGAALAGEFTYSVLEADPSARKRSAPKDAGGGERRDGQRTRSHLREGFVGERLTRSLAGCRITDLSKGGARLLLDADSVLPGLFFLVDASAGKKYRARLAWQRGREAGVSLKEVD